MCYLKKRDSSFGDFLWYAHFIRSGEYYCQPAGKAQESRFASPMRIGEALEQFGISCFVAHDNIEPMESWQHQIEAGLETMEVFLAMITDDFHDSVWTNQEIGFAKSRGVPVVCLKLGKDPKGFIAEKQALAGNPRHPEASAAEIYKLMSEKLGMRERLQPALITAFCESPSYIDTRDRFDRMKSLVTKLSKDEAERIKQAFNTNDQLHNAAYSHPFCRAMNSFCSSSGTWPVQ